MERINGLHPTVTRQERFRGTGRTLPIVGPSFAEIQRTELPANFPGPDSTPEEARAYLLGPRLYPHRGYTPRIPSLNGLNHNSHR